MMAVIAPLDQMVYNTKANCTTWSHPKRIHLGAVSTAQATVRISTFPWLALLQ